MQKPPYRIDGKFPRSRDLIALGVSQLFGVTRPISFFVHPLGQVGQDKGAGGVFFEQLDNGVRFSLFGMETCFTALARNIPEWEIRLEQASAFAEEQALNRLLHRQAELSSTNRDRLDQEKVKLERYYEYRQMAAADKVESVRKILERVLASGDTVVQRIIPVWTRNLENAKRVEVGLAEERQRMVGALAGRGQMTAQHESFTASYVEIVKELP